MSSFLSRVLEDSRSFSLWNYTYYNDNNSTYEDFESNLKAPEDVSVDAVLTSVYFNAVVFVFLMASYECLRRLLPTVYSSRSKLDHVRPDGYDAFEDNKDGIIRETSELSSLPDARPLDWIGPVFGIPWSKVRKTAGLDGYFFLRYIRMNVRITAVSTVWFFLVLVPIYATGHNTQYAAQGWYHISAANLPRDGWRMWVPCVFAYLFSGFIAFVVKQEYRHFLDLRQDFLARGTAHINPQHHYSLKVENIPYELRSDRALMEYFDQLFPGKVHSASVVLNLPDLQEASQRCMRTCRRLEKSLAYLKAVGERPTHVVGRGRLSILGVDLQPIDLNCFPDNEESLIIDEDDWQQAKPAKGTRVDSISYYVQELAMHSRVLFHMQQRKTKIAQSGNVSIKAQNWLDDAVRSATVVANQIMDESLMDNDLLAPSNSNDLKVGIAHAESMTSRYGSFSPATLEGRQSTSSSEMLPTSTEGNRRINMMQARKSVRDAFLLWMCP